MKNKLNNKLLILILLIIVTTITGCSSGGSGDGNDGGLTDWLSLDIYVKVVNSSGQLVEADSIVLLNKKQRKVIDYQQNITATQFRNLENGEYIMVAGKEGVGYAEFSPTDRITTDRDITLTLDENVDEDQINITTTPSEVDMTIKKGTTIYQNYDNYQINSGSAVVEIWPGVIYNYEFSQDGYSVYNKDYLSLNQDSNLEVVLNQTNNSAIAKYIYDTKDSKKISLGSLASDESAIIAISPLNLDAENNNRYDASLTIDYDYSKQANLLAIPNKRDNKLTNLEAQQQITTNQANTSNNQLQSEADRKMRELENKLLQEELNLVAQQSMLKLQSNYELDQQESFDVYDFDSNSYKGVPATLKAKGEHAYVFVANSVINDEETWEEIKELIPSLTTEFDNNIYHKTMSNFANAELNTSAYDWDDNGRKTILITDMGKGSKEEGIVMGFFNPIDSNYYADDSNSNNADMFYINSWALKYAQDSNRRIKMDAVYGTLAHEFQHLLFFINKVKAKRYITDTWINEGFSGLAEYLTGYYSYSQDGRIYDGSEDNPQGYFNNSAHESLLFWNQKLSDYGASNLFAYHLYNRFGIEIVKDISSSSKDPIEVISNYQDFSDLFLEWMITNYISKQNLSNRYSYPDSQLSSPEIENLNIDGNYDFSIDNTGVKYYKIEGTGTPIDLKIDLNQRTGVIIYR